MKLSVIGAELITEPRDALVNVNAAVSVGAGIYKLCVYREAMP